MTQSKERRQLPTLPLTSLQNDGGDESNTWTHTIMGRSGLVNWLVWTLTADAVSWAYPKFVNLDQFAEPKFTYGGLNFFIFSDLSHLVE